MQRSHFINLPLHTGHPPAYLVRRMIKLSHAMSKVIVDSHGQLEFLRRLSDPVWFQAFGCVLGFDWHSSGVTTVVTGILKQSLSPDVHGIAIAGGKGARATRAVRDVPAMAESFGLSDAKTAALLRASRMSAKVDSAAVQDGYSLYHHAILFSERGDWAVVQQGMNAQNRMARRYHWISENLSSAGCSGGNGGFASEPHAGIICAQKTEAALDMTAAGSAESQKVCLDLARGNTENLKSSIYRMMMPGGENTLDRWMAGEGGNNNNSNNGIRGLAGYEMPRRLDWDLFREIYDVQPKNYEELLGMRGVGAATVRALALVAELIYGTPASWRDPVKYSFAHGGKDGVPHPVARKTYDQSIQYLQGAIEGAEMERQDRIAALKKLAAFSEQMFPSDDDDDDLPSSSSSR
ncbi:DUF763 domain-containing protein [Nitrososphaera sp.]|uniref:DUF763 domain-containing protein n=1 Tax=Nitrososphaera sp. TaxID=1971748 RepID=UPI00307E23DA